EGPVTQFRKGGMTWEEASVAARTELPALFRTLARNGTWVDPTLVASWALTRRVELAGKPDAPGKYLASSTKRHRGPAFPVTPEPREVTAQRVALFDMFLQWVGEMSRAGVRLVAGTDTGVRDVYPGFSLHDELGWLAKGGLSEMEALQAATRNAALALGRAESSGTVEKGKEADLVLLDANPLDDIGNTRKIHAVVLRGRLLRREALTALLAEAEAAGATK